MNKSQNRYHFPFFSVRMKGWRTKADWSPRCCKGTEYQVYQRKHNLYRKVTTIIHKYIVRPSPTRNFIHNKRSIIIILFSILPLAPRSTTNITWNTIIINDEAVNYAIIMSCTNIRFNYFIFSPLECFFLWSLHLSSAVYNYLI